MLCVSLSVIPYPSALPCVNPTSHSTMLRADSPFEGLRPQEALGKAAPRLY